MQRIGRTNENIKLEGLRCGKNLKGKDIYKTNQGIYINPSLCREYKHIGYVIRKLKGKGEVEQYRIRNGVYFIKIENEFKEISHKCDFDKYGLDVSAFSE